jgi:hypothetical protein
LCSKLRRKELVAMAMRTSWAARCAKGREVPGRGWTCRWCTSRGELHEWDKCR